jgi:hypothetical protein
VAAPEEHNAAVVPLWVVARAQLRRRLLGAAALAALVGVAAGVVIAGLAGARRTESSMDRFVDYAAPTDVVVTVNGPQTTLVPSAADLRAVGATRDRVRRLPQVASSARTPYVFLSPDASGAGVGSLNAFAAADEAAFRTVNRPLVLSGRLADPARADEAVVDDEAAEQRHLAVGEVVPLWSYSAAQNDAVASSGAGRFPAPAGTRYEVRVVGVVRMASTVYRPPVDVSRDVDFLGRRSILLTPAFLRRFAADQHVPLEALPGSELLQVRLRHGVADLHAFEAGVRRTVAPGDGQVQVGSDIREAADAVRRPIHVEAIALLVFAVVAAGTATLVLTPALARQVATDDDRTLVALGLSRVQRAALPALRAALVAAGAAAVGVVLAIVLSPLTPIGIARRAEIDPGVHVDVRVLAAGAAAVLLVVPLLAFVAAWRRTGEASASDRRAAPRSSGRWVEALGARRSASAAAGAALLVRRRAAGGIVVLGATVAVAGVVAALTFGASLRHLVDSPREQGWDWDVVVGNPNSSALAGTPPGRALHDDLVDALARNPYVGSFLGFTVATVRIEGVPVGLVGLEPHRGRVSPVLVDGRAPHRADEVVLGAHTLQEVGARVGQRVVVEAGGRRLGMRVVGTLLEPTAGDLSTRLGDGAAAPVGVLGRLGAPTDVFRFAVAYRPGADRDAALRSLVSDFGRTVLRPYPGGEVGDLDRVEGLPYALAGLLTALGAAALALGLGAIVRRHRADLAVLKSIGFLRRQVTATVTWQAAAVAVVAIVVGVPVGVAIGRWAWRSVATGVGSVSPPVVPLTAVVVVAGAALVAAMVLAAVPARAAARIPVAPALRRE